MGFTVCVFGMLQKVLDGLRHLAQIMGGFEALYNVSVAIDKELGEVPLDLTALLIFWVGLAQDSIKNWCDLVAHIEARESLLS